MNNKLPSGAKANRLKNDVNVSFAYILVFLNESPENGSGEFSMGLTAGNGIDGAGEADRLIDGEDPNDERRLCEMVGGFIGSANEVGVPGIEGVGAGEAGATDDASGKVLDLRPRSGGAGLLADILLAGMSIFVTLLC